MDLALNNLQGLIFHKTQTTKQLFLYFKGGGISFWRSGYSNMFAAAVLVSL